MMDDQRRSGASYPTPLPLKHAAEKQELLLDDAMPRTRIDLRCDLRTEPAEDGGALLHPDQRNVRIALVAA